MDDLIYELEDVSFSYLGKFPALRNIRMQIRRGERTAVLGANGSGKSTLLQLLDGLIFPEAGVVKFLGKELTAKMFNSELFSGDFRRSVGFVFQNPDIQLFCPTVREDIMFGPLQLGLDRAESARRFTQLVDILALGGLLDRSPHQLSIGEQRKAALASTLIIGPRVIILDEPTAGLDPLTARHIIDLLLEENAAGATIITSTHDLHILDEIAQTVHVFGSDKTILRSGPPGEILNDTELLRLTNLIHIHTHRHGGAVHSHPHQHIDHHGEEHTH
ncbi:MAG: ABC transporter ATP-binding protein [Candidatus Omnitrophota bacterium]